MFSKEFLAYQSQIPSAPPPQPGESGKMPPMPSPEIVIPEGCTGGKVVVGGVPGLHITKSGVREAAALLYIHGGGFTLGSGMDAGPLLGHFLTATNLEGYSVDYALAPAAKFPVAINQCVSFYKGLLGKGYKTIVVGGESAGAAMTLSLMFALKAENLLMPAALWCSSPLDNIRFDLEELFHRDMFTDSADMILESYVGDADVRDPRLSPIYGDFSDFPPTFIQAGSRESLSAGALRLVDKLVRAGNDVRFTFGKGMPHTFAMDYQIYPEARHAMNEILQFINDRLELV